MHPYFRPKQDPEEYIQSVRAIYLRKKTQIEMVRDRGFTIPKKEQTFLIDYASFLKTGATNDSLDRIYTRKADGHKLSVLYNIADAKSKAKQNKSLMQTVDQQYESEEADSFIIVTIPQITTADFTKELKFLIEIFTFEDLAVNPTTNALSPLHIPMTTMEKNAFLESINAEARQIPGIPLENPVVRYFGAKLGDMFYIRRIPGEEVSYYIEELEYWRIVRDIPVVIAAGAKISDEGDEDEEGEDNRRVRQTSSQKRSL